MSNLEFLRASERGDLESVQRLLASNKIDINFKEIWNQHYFWNSDFTFLMQFKYNFYEIKISLFMVFENNLTHGIKLKFLIIQHWFMLQWMVT